MVSIDMINETRFLDNGHVHAQDIDMSWNLEKSCIFGSGI